MASAKPWLVGVKVCWATHGIGSGLGSHLMVSTPPPLWVGFGLKPDTVSANVAPAGNAPAETVCSVVPLAVEGTWIRRAQLSPIGSVATQSVDRIWNAVELEPAIKVAPSRLRMLMPMLVSTAVRICGAVKGVC